MKIQSFHSKLTSPPLNANYQLLQPSERSLLKILWENAVNQHFLLFPQCFPPYQKKVAPFESQ